MTEAQKKMMDKLGLTEQDFQPSEKTDAERIDDLEVTTDDIILMMAELIGGV